MCNAPQAGPIMTFERPLRCKPPVCCCHLNEVTVYNGAGGGAPVGMLVQNYTCCASEIDIIVGDQVMYKI